MQIENPPTYKIFGKERRALKKEFKKKQSLHKHFWFYHQLDLDMSKMFPSGDSCYPMSKEKADALYSKLGNEVKELEIKLSEKFKNC